MNLTTTLTAGALAAVAAATLGAGTAQASTAYGYENYTSTSWGRVDHTATKDGVMSAVLKIRLADQAADGHCVYVNGTVRVNNGPDYTRRIGRVCGSGTAGTFSYRFAPVAGTSIRGVDVRLCREDALADTCVTEYNGV